MVWLLHTASAHSTSYHWPLSGLLGLAIDFLRHCFYLSAPQALLLEPVFLYLLSAGGLPPHGCHFPTSSSVANPSTSVRFYSVLSPVQSQLFLNWSPPHQQEWTCLKYQSDISGQVRSETHQPHSFRKLQVLVSPIAPSGGICPSQRGLQV